MVWTAEPTYPDPDRELERDARRWRAQVDPQRLRRSVEAIAVPRSRLHAPEGITQVEAHLVDAWRDAGWRVGRQRLRFRSVRGLLDPAGLAGEPHRNLSGVNVVAIRRGQTDEAIVLVAHLDTVRDSPGADDNAAALAALMELARALGTRHWRRTVILAAPDLEEVGLIGSRPLVRWLRHEYRVRGALVFDPIGYMNPQPEAVRVPSAIEWLYPGQAARVRAREFRGDHVVAIYRRHSVELAQTWARCLAATIGRDRVVLLRDPLDLPLIGPWLYLAPVARNFSRSDHLNFWLAGLSAIQVTNTANFVNPHYHRSTDTPQTLDYGSLARITAAMGLAVERLAQS